MHTKLYFLSPSTPKQLIPSDKLYYPTTNHQLLTTNTVTFLTESSSYGDIIGMVRDGVTYYFLTNAHSDVLAAVDESGKIVASWEYDTWGVPKSTAGIMM